MGPTMDSRPPSDTVLDETPGRALKLLGAIGTNPYVRAALAKRGYTEATHEQGWTLLLAAGGYRQPTSALPEADGEAVAALAEIDAWDEPNFRVARAALGTSPEQLAFVFEGLDAASGPGAIVSVSMFLDRLDALRTGKGRAGSKKEDHAALDKLAERGISEVECKRLRKLVETAKRGISEAHATAPAEPPKNVAQRRAAKAALYAFFAEWSEIARADIKRRDHLIQLGLAKRKSPKRDPKPSDEG